jgi:hypothetical protein
MAKRCKNCAWWKTEEWMSKGWGECAMATTAGGMIQHEESLSMAIDFESYQASLITNEKFGCVQWEKKGVDDVPVD